ncbi:MAG: trigger factor [Thiohalospira sp.]|uniref:trigger factor n=1 Tax=Thiohalospira sp. TaxID=3080549 RepID=UPI003980D68C
MDVSVESPGGLERRLTVTVPDDRVTSQVDQRLEQMRKNARIDGFRPGKVPLSVMRKRYGPQVREEVVGEVIQSSLIEALGQQELNPAGTPQVEAPQIGDDGRLTFTARFEVYPEVTVPDAASLEVERPQVTIEEGDVDRTLDMIREQRKEWVEKEGPAEEGDRVTLDFKGYVDGEAFEGGEANDFAVEIGSANMIEGFEDGLRGASAGEHPELEVTFPEDYPVEDLAGKTARFETTVKKVEAAQLPEVTEEFATSLGMDSVQALRDEVRANMERELNQRLRERVKDQVMEQLWQNHQLDLPQGLVDQEADNLVEQMRQQMQSQGAAAQDVNLDRSMFDEQARRRVALGLILSKVVEEEGLQADRDEVRAKVEEIAAPYEQPQQVIDYYYGDRQRLAEIESLVLEGKVVEWFAERAQVTEKPLSFQELMNPGAEEAEGENA